MKRRVFWKNPGYRIGRPVKGIHKTEYLIVGAGITGLMLAHFLLKRGIKGSDITIVEAGVVAGGSTGRSAGILIPEIETETNVGWDTFVVRYGLSLAKKYRRAYRQALNAVEELIEEGGISCEAHTGDFLILARDDEAKERVKSDIRARRLMGERPQGLRGVQLAREFGSPGFIFAERDVEALSVNPLMLAQGIADHLRRQSVRIFEHSPLDSTYGHTARFANGAISFKKIIYARGVGENHRLLHKYVTTIVVTERLKKEELEELKLADLDLFIDEEGTRSFHYGKVTGDGRLLFGYGDVRVRVHSAKTELHSAHLANIKRFIKTMFPKTPLKVAYAWSGAYAIGCKLTAIIEFKKHEVVVNGAGIQLGSIAAAEYVATKLVGKKHPLDPLWEPGSYSK